jgi:epoxyqueuosine reductase
MMYPRLSTQSIKQEAHRLGFDLCRIISIGEAPHFDFFTAWLEQGCAGEMTYLQRNAEKRRVPSKLASIRQAPIRSMVVLAVNYCQDSSEENDSGDSSRGIIARYAHGKDYHDLIRPRLHQLDAFIARQTGRTSQGKCLVDSGPVLERDWAQLAGIGFTGKNCCTIHPCMGSWLLLATVLVPEELEPDSSQLDESLEMDASRIIGGLPVRGDYGSWQIPVPMDIGEDITEKTGTCGACSRCLAACPTRAFVGPYYLDPRRCISYWTIESRGSIPRELRPMFGNRIFGCDICQDVCPWNRRLKNREPSIPGLQLDHYQCTPPLLEGFNPKNPYWLDDNVFTAHFAGTALLRPGRRGMLRNVCVALGNWGALEALPALSIALEGAEPIVRTHAVWAVGQVIRKNGGTEGEQLLKSRLKIETDANVIDEINIFI